MHPRRNRSQSVSEGDRNRQRLPPTIPFSLPPFAITTTAPTQQFDTQLSFPYGGLHEDFHPDPLDDILRAMAATYTTEPAEQQLEASTSASPIQHSFQHLHPHSSPNLPLQVDATTLALLQLLQAQSPGHQPQGAPSTSNPRYQDRGEVPSGLHTNEPAAPGGDGNAEEDEDQMEASETERSAMSEDKRRRNTAASARFRNKKKQWILNLERTVTSLSRRVDELEHEATDLRRENGWLKEIVMLKTSRLAGGARPRDKPREPEKDEDTARKDGGSGSGKGKGKQKKSP